jgi:hypothetical protein
LFRNKISSEDRAVALCAPAPNDPLWWRHTRVHFWLNYSVYAGPVEPLQDQDLTLPFVQLIRERNAVPLVIDGTEDLESRGLIVLSALTFVTEALADLPIIVLAGKDPVVHTAALCLRWDTALRIDIADANVDPSVVMRGASLFVAVAHRSVASQYLPTALQACVATLLPVQFPADHVLTPPMMALVRAAHDPRVLGATIVTRLGLRA